MFHKKILGLISLLFVGSQIKSVSADCTLSTEDCAKTGSEDCVGSQFGYYVINNKLCEVTGASAIGEVAATEIGYFKTVSGSYYSRNYSGAVSSAITVDGETCDDDAVGSLVKINSEVKLCLESGITIPFDNKSKKYLLKKKKSSNIFTNDTDDNKVYVVLDQKENSITMDASYGENKFCTYLTNEIMSRHDNFCEGSALNKLYGCTSGLCEYLESPINSAGDYVVTLTDRSGIYTCTGSGGSVSCTGVDTSSGTGIKIIMRSNVQDETYGDIIGSSVTCDADNVGKIIYDSGSFKECKKTSDTPTYENVAIDDTIEINKIELFDCHKGTCKITEGFIKYDSKTASCDSDGCTDATNTNCDAGNIGKVLYKDGNVNICQSVDVEGGTAAGAIVSGLNFAATSVTNNFNLYISDAATNPNVIGLSVSGGNFLKDTNKLAVCTADSTCSEDASASGYYLNYENDQATNPLILCDYDNNPGTCKYVTIAEDGYYISNDDKLVFCDHEDVGTECSILENKSGYFLNAGADNTAKPLIKFDSTWQTATADAIGYYINSDKGVISCSDSTQCDNVSPISSVNSCGSDKNKIINDNNVLKYCNDEEKLDLGATPKYYTIGSVTASTSYPGTVTAGSDTILLKVDQYSVTKVITDDSGICVKDNALDGGCSSGSTKYTCTSANSGKCGEQVISVCDPTAGSPSASCEGYYLVSGGSLVESNIGNGGYTLYKCPGGGAVCETPNTKGFYKVKDATHSANVPYIKCNGQNQCLGLSIPASSTECKTVGAGKLSNNGAVKVCVNNADSPIELAFSDNDNDNYFINTEAFTGTSAPNDFYMLTVSEYAIEVKTDDASKYKYSGSNQKVLIKKAGVCTGVDPLYEYASGAQGVYTREESTD